MYIATIAIIPIVAIILIKPMGIYTKKRFIGNKINPNNILINIMPKCIISISFLKEKSWPVEYQSICFKIKIIVTNLIKNQIEYGLPVLRSKSLK